MMQYNISCIAFSLFLKIKLEEIVRMIDKLFSKLSFWRSFLLAGNQRLLFRVHPINANTTYFAALESSRRKLPIVISLRIESNYKVARQEDGAIFFFLSSFLLFDTRPFTLRCFYYELSSARRMPEIVEVERWERFSGCWERTVEEQEERLKSEQNGGKEGPGDGEVA